MIDNSAIVRPFVPESEDLGLFVYTELLDRTKRVGNNGVRVVHPGRRRLTAGPAMTTLGP